VALKQLIQNPHREITLSSLRLYQQILYQPGRVVLELGIIGAILALIAYVLQSGFGFNLFLGVSSSLIASTIVGYLLVVRMELNEQLMQTGIVQVWPDRSEIPGREWIKKVGSCKKSCLILGVALRGYREDEDFKEVVKKAVRQNPPICFRILLLNPNSRAAAVRDDEERRNTREDIKQTLQVFFDLKQEVEREQPNTFKLYIYTATPTFSVLWTDESEMIVTHYLGEFEK
jgi:hypothetical protein